MRTDRLARVAAVLIAAAALVACGGGAAGSGAAPSRPASTNPGPTTSQNATPTGTSTATPTGRPTPTATRAATAPPPPATSAAAHTASFSGPSGDPMRGTVTLTPIAGGYSVHVQASGLVSGHAYALHVHGGRCVGQGTVTTTFQLPAMTADAKGNGSVTATLVNVPPLGPTFVLHVHEGTTPGTTDYRRVACTPLPG